MQDIIKYLMVNCMYYEDATKYSMDGCKVCPGILGSWIAHRQLLLAEVPIPFTNWNPGTDLTAAMIFYIIKVD